MRSWTRTRRMEERAAGLRNEEKTIRIGTVFPLATETVPRMLREFGATFPFIIYNRMTPEISEGLLEGKYDIGFCSDLLKSEDLEYYPINESFIAAAVPKGHPWKTARRSLCRKRSSIRKSCFPEPADFEGCRRRSLQKKGST